MNFIIVVTTCATISTAADKANHLSCEQIVKKSLFKIFSFYKKVSYTFREDINHYGQHEQQKQQ